VDELKAGEKRGRSKRKAPNVEESEDKPTSKRLRIKTVGIVAVEPKQGPSLWKGRGEGSSTRRARSPSAEVIEEDEDDEDIEVAMEIDRAEGGSGNGGDEEAARRLRVYEQRRYVATLQMCANSLENDVHNADADVLIARHRLQGARTQFAVATRTLQEALERLEEMEAEE
jgi:hypothetical protein